MAGSKTAAQAISAKLRVGRGRKRRGSHGARMGMEGAAGEGGLSGCETAMVPYPIRSALNPRGQWCIGMQFRGGSRGQDPAVHVLGAETIC